MNTYILKPLESVGEIIFSANRADVRALLGENIEFKKNKFSKNTTDDFKFCQVFYDIENLCEAVEISPNDAIVTFDGIDLTNLNFLQIKEYLHSVDVSIEVTEDSVTSNKLGISVYAPNGMIESLLFFKHGYFE